MKWIAKQHEAASRRGLEAIAEVEENILVYEKGKRKIFDNIGGREKLEVLRKPTCVERIFGNRGKEAKMQQEKHTKEEKEMKNGGNKEGVS